MTVTINGTTGIVAPAIDVTTPITVSDGGTGLTSVGTSGNVLTSNGTSWVSSAPAGGSPDTQQFTSSGTWTKPATGNLCYVLLVGGGGGGGRNSSGNNNLGGTGSTVTCAVFKMSDLPSTVAVTIGSGGSGSSSYSTAGGNGGTTTFANFLQCFGGQGGNSTDGSSSGSPAALSETNSIYGSSAIALVGGIAKATVAYSPYGWPANIGIGPEPNYRAQGGGAYVTGGQIQNSFGTGGAGSTGTGSAGTGYGSGGGAGGSAGGAGAAGYCRVVVV